MAFQHQLSVPSLIALNWNTPRALVAFDSAVSDVDPAVGGSADLGIVSYEYESDALLLIEKTRVGAFPVVDENLKVTGIVSDSDLLKAFISFLGIKEPGTLLGIVAELTTSDVMAPQIAFSMVE